jgi:hypothetical protein
VFGFSWQIRSLPSRKERRDRKIKQELESEIGKKLFDGPDIDDPEI